jgi:hypothetical protein
VSELFAVRYHTVFTTNALSGLCHIWYRVFPGKTPAFVLTVQWFANPALYLYVYCVPYNVFTCILRFQNDQFRTQFVVYIYFRRRSVSDLVTCRTSCAGHLGKRYGLREHPGAVLVVLHLQFILFYRNKNLRSQKQ